MARIDDLPLWLRPTLKVYPWRRVESVPRAQFVRPLDACTVALVTLIATAGLVPPGEAPFDPRVKGGDASFRVIGGEAGVADLKEHHRSKSFDHSGIVRDRNLALPLDRLRELAAERVISHGQEGSGGSEREYQDNRSDDLPSLAHLGPHGTSTREEARRYSV